MRLGVLGGTFNPPHLGHLVCGQEAYVQLALDQVMLVPARTPPHKSVPDEPGPEHRLALCRAAAAGDERFIVSTLELDRPAPSYTVDTLAQLHAQAPDSELFLIVGGDMAASVPQWHSPARVLSLARLAVAEREGNQRAEIERVLEDVGSPRFFEMPRIDLSSTMVRARVKARQPIRYLVPDGVAAHIEQHGLYRGEA